MKPSSIVTLVIATLLGVGTACWLDAHEPRRPWPKPTPPPPPSPIYTPSPERVPTEDEIAQQAREHNEYIALAIESSLAANGPQQRETAFTFLLPELLQVEPDRVVTMVDRQKPGEARDVLIFEVARQWIGKDAAAAIAWMKSLNEEERLASATAAVASIAPHSPAEAMALAEEFGVGDEDGSRELQRRKPEHAAAL